MKWKGRTRSSNVEDRRGSGDLGIGGKGALGGGLGIIILIVICFSEEIQAKSSTNLN
mgnify:CR=1 FL=1